MTDDPFKGMGEPLREGTTEAPQAHHGGNTQPQPTEPPESTEPIESPSTLQFEVTHELDPSVEIKSKVKTEGLGLRGHNYYSVMFAMDLLTMIKQWKEIGFAPILIPHNSFSLKPPTMKLRLMCAKQYLIDHPEFCQQYLEEVGGLEVMIRDGQVQLHYRKRVTAARLIEVMVPIASVNKPIILHTISEELQAWINSNPIARDKFVRLKLKLQEQEIASIQSIIDANKTAYTGIVRADQVIVIRLVT